MSHEISSNFSFWWMSESYLKDISVSLQACVCLLWAHKHHETMNRNSPRNGSSCCRCKNTKTVTICVDVCSSNNFVESGEKQRLQWLFAYFQHFSLKFKLWLWSCVSSLIGVIVGYVSRKIGSWAVFEKTKNFVVIAIAIAMAWIGTHSGSIWNIYGKLKRD